MVDKLVELGAKKELMGKLGTVLPQRHPSRKTFAFAKNPNLRALMLAVILVLNGLDINYQRVYEKTNLLRY